MFTGDSKVTVWPLLRARFFMTIPCKVDALLELLHSKAALAQKWGQAVEE